MVMDNIKEDTIVGARLATPIEQSFPEEKSLTLEKTDSTKSDLPLVAEIIPLEPTVVAEDPKTQLPHLPQSPQPTKQAETSQKRLPPPQQLTEILWQHVKNMEDSNLVVRSQNVWIKGVPTVCLVFFEMFICESCHDWNYGRSCKNKDCDKFEVEIVPQNK